MSDEYKSIWDFTLVEHFLISIVLTGLGFIAGHFFAGVLYAGAAFAVAWFICRECVRAEYEWIEHYGNGLRSNMPWWAFLDKRVWDWGSILDMVSAILGVCLACFARELYYR